MAELMPITSPSRLSSGPPLLPGLMAASVCRKSSYMFMWMFRLLALMIPDVTVPVSPSGAPMASTRSPISTASLSPRVTKGSGSFASIRTTARSVFGSFLMARPVKVRPSWR